MPRTRTNEELAPVTDRPAETLERDVAGRPPKETDALELVLTLADADHDDPALVVVIEVWVQRDGRTWEQASRHRIRGGPILTDNGIEGGPIVQGVRDRFRLAPHPTWCAARPIRVRVTPNRPLRYGLQFAHEQPDVVRVR
jgi:hypothetical protein